MVRAALHGVNSPGVRRLAALLLAKTEATRPVPRRVVYTPLHGPTRCRSPGHCCWLRLPPFEIPPKRSLPRWNTAEDADPTSPPDAVRCESTAADRLSPTAPWPSTEQSPEPPPVSGRADAPGTRAPPGASRARCATRVPAVTRTTRGRCLGHTQSIPTPRHPENGRGRAGPSPRMTPSRTHTRPISCESD